MVVQNASKNPHRTITNQQSTRESGVAIRAHHSSHYSSDMVNESDNHAQKSFA